MSEIDWVQGAVDCIVVDQYIALVTTHNVAIPCRELMLGRWEVDFHGRSRPLSSSMFLKPCFCNRLPLHFKTTVECLNEIFSCLAVTLIITYHRCVFHVIRVAACLSRLCIGQLRWYVRLIGLLHRFGPSKLWTHTHTHISRGAILCPMRCKKCLCLIIY